MGLARVGAGAVGPPILHVGGGLGPLGGPFAYAASVGTVVAVAAASGGVGAGGRWEACLCDGGPLWAGRLRESGEVGRSRAGGGAEGSYEDGGDGSLLASSRGTRGHLTKVQQGIKESRGRAAKDNRGDGTAVNGEDDVRESRRGGRARRESSSETNEACPTTSTLPCRLWPDRKRPPPLFKPPRPRLRRPSSNMLPTLCESC